MTPWFGIPSIPLAPAWTSRPIYNFGPMLRGYTPIPQKKLRIYCIYFFQLLTIDTANVI